jgi:hypothetical protein
VGESLDPFHPRNQWFTKNHAAFKFKLGHRGQRSCRFACLAAALAKAGVCFVLIRFIPGILNWKELQIQLNIETAGRAR